MPWHESCDFFFLWKHVWICDENFCKLFYFPYRRTKFSHYSLARRMPLFNSGPKGAAFAQKSRLDPQPNLAFSYRESCDFGLYFWWLYGPRRLQPLIDGGRTKRIPRLNFWSLLLAGRKFDFWNISPFRGAKRYAKVDANSIYFQFPMGLLANLRGERRILSRIWQVSSRRCRNRISGVGFPIRIISSLADNQHRY